MTRLRGGRTLYGHALGIIMLDTAFPRLPGDVGNATTWPFPVLYRPVSGALPERMAQPTPDPSLMEPFRQAACELEAQGVRAIITSCGFLAVQQVALAAAVRIPVFSSPLLQVPFAARTIAPERRVAILTARLALTEAHFNGAGWASRDLQVHVAAPPETSHFVETFVGNRREADVDALEWEVIELAERTVRSHPDTGAFVLECANFSPFADAVRRASGLPVYDLFTLGMSAFHATADRALRRDL